MFDEYYGSIVGDRWPSLRDQLAQPAQQVARYTCWARLEGLQPLEPVGLPFCGVSPDEDPPLTSQGLLAFYRMDLASVFPALELAVEAGDRVLDMCAAPGGKSLILAEGIAGAGELVVNDLSEGRLSRLKRVLRQHVPTDVMARIRVTHHEASRWGLFEPQTYDKVLLDAPCSGERHLLQTPEELKLWSRARSKHLSGRQYALLCAAVDSTKPGGRVVYSTCSVSQIENDDVIAKLLKKRKGSVEVLSISNPIGESTAYGHQIWPDQSGWGPIYYSCLQKIKEE